MDEGPLRYVILRHEGIPNPHFDLMFEQYGATPLLATFRSPIWPIDRRTALVHLDDHRLEYLEYEGLVTGNRGSVRRVESGTHTFAQRGVGEWHVKLSSTTGEHAFALRCTFPPQESWEAEPSPAPT